MFQTIFCDSLEKRTVEFCVKPVNNSSIKGLRIAAFNESIEDRFWFDLYNINTCFRHKCTIPY